MRQNFLSKILISGAIASMMLAPLSAFGQSHGRGKGHDDHHNWNSPKQNGRHDNRDWNKKSNSDDWRRRQTEDRARQAEERRRDELRRREQYQRTRNYNGRNYNYNNNNQWEIDRRNQTKNEWRNLAIGSGLVSVLGLLSKDSTLTFAGAAGSLYSLYRYEQDRKSQSSLERGRAYYFSQPYFYRNGTRFDRREVTKNGQRYYQFVRHH